MRFSANLCSHDSFLFRTVAHPQLRSIVTVVGTEKECIINGKKIARGTAVTTGENILNQLSAVFLTVTNPQFRPVDAVVNPEI